MKPLYKVGLILGQAVVVLAAFKVGQVVKAGQAGVKPWNAYTGQVPPGVALNPVPLNVENRNAAVVLRGSYLVNAVQHCNSCHTCPPYAGEADPLALGILPPINTVNYLAGGRRFGAANDPDAPVSANLTPDPKTGLPGGLTFAEFLSTLRTGRTHKTGRDLKVMPWPMFNDLADTDLMAIYEYLRAIPHAEPRPNYPSETGSRTLRPQSKPGA
jgi:hypothetical protein